ncbi:hypothetical protein [uncultured Allobaculum sp.]|uniref:hypothetical protein n=1 Tax=uncultured Allobaculum sp. TaxID=1187017 RepID=UPI0025899C01|nr:hypothetical protein [uncultured Allobaculum sp.]
MNFKDPYRNLLRKRIAVSDEAITFSELFIKDTVHLFAANIPDAMHFLKNNCTEDEYSWISEIIDDSAEQSKSVELIEAYKNLAEKYPEETKSYNIKSFINSAMAIAEPWQEDED